MTTKETTYWQQALYRYKHDFSVLRSNSIRWKTPNTKIFVNKLYLQSKNRVRVYYFDCEIFKMPINIKCHNILIIDILFLVTIRFGNCLRLFEKLCNYYEIITIILHY